MPQLFPSLANLKHICKHISSVHTQHFNVYKTFPDEYTLKLNQAAVVPFVMCGKGKTSNKSDSLLMATTFTPSVTETRGMCFYFRLHLLKPLLQMKHTDERNRNEDKCLLQRLVNFHLVSSAFFLPNYLLPCHWTACVYTHLVRHLPPVLHSS